MLLLALDSSTPRVTVALVDVGSDASVDLLAEHSDDAGNRHGELLAPAIDGVLAAAGAKPHDLGAVAAGLGPGPFTGLRVGIVTAASVADGLGVPAYGVCSLDALAAAHPGARRLLAVTDARRKQVYWARYDAGVRVEGPDVSAPADVAAVAAEQVDRVAGAGAIQWADAFAGLAIEASEPFPQARFVAQLAAAHDGTGRLLAVTDARRKQVYWASYDGGVRVDGPEISAPADLAAAQGDRLVGAGALQWADVFAGLAIDGSDPLPQARFVAQLAASRAATRAPSEQLTPMYLRRPDAQPPGAPKPVTPQ